MKFIVFKTYLIDVSNIAYVSFSDFYLVIYWKTNIDRLSITTSADEQAIFVTEVTRLKS